MPDRHASERSSPESPALRASSGAAGPQVGDRLIVTGGYRREAETERFATVVNIRRRYFAADIDRGSYDPERVDFDRESGYERTGPNDNGHYARRARTPEQFDYDSRRDAALKVLSDHDLTFRHFRCPLTDEQVFAIAALLDSGDAGASSATRGEAGR